MVEEWNVRIVSEMDLEQGLISIQQRSDKHKNKREEVDATFNETGLRHLCLV